MCAALSGRGGSIGGGRGATPYKIPCSRMPGHPIQTRPVKGNFCKKAADFPRPVCKTGLYSPLLLEVTLK